MSPETICPMKCGPYRKTRETKECVYYECPKGHKAAETKSLATPIFTSHMGYGLQH